MVEILGNAFSAWRSVSLRVQDVLGRLLDSFDRLNRRTEIGLLLNPGSGGGKRAMAARQAL